VRRCLLIAAFVLSCGLLLSFAQRGPMRGGASFGMGGAPRGGMHMAGAAGFVGAPHGAVHFGGGFHPPVHGPIHIHHGIRIRTVPPFYYYGGYAYPYSYPYSSPFLWDWHGSSYHDSNDSEVTLALMRQIDALSQQVESLREEHASFTVSPTPVSTAAQVPTQTRTQPPEPDLTTVLVFLDRRIQEVKNYAIVNETVMVYDDHHLRKIPLADVDLASTMKLNDERGVEFRIPDPAGTK